MQQDIHRNFKDNFSRQHAQERKILGVLVNLAEGNRIITQIQIIGIMEDTTIRYLCKASQHAGELKTVLITDCRLK